MWPRDHFHSRGLALAVISVLWPETAAAEGTKTATSAVAAPKPPADAQYHLPFMLRGVWPGRVFRIDTNVATFDSRLAVDPTIVSFLTLAYSVTPEVGLAFRIAYVSGSGAVDDRRGSTFSDPVLSVLWAPRVHRDLRLSGLLAVGLPVGGGGGDNPNPYSKNARTAAVIATSSMNNTHFAPNDLCLVPDIAVAYVKDGVTLQLEAAVGMAFRVRGSQDQPDTFKSNLALGLHFGYFLAPWVSFGTELRYSRFLAPPKTVDTSPNRAALMDTISVALGPRFHIRLSDSSWLRPAITYARGLDDPMSAANYQIVQVDLPFSY